MIPEDLSAAALDKLDTIFHYTSSAVALEQILYGGTFKLSPFGMTNDPREYKRWSFGVAGWGLPPGDDFQKKWLTVDVRTNAYLRSYYKVGCFCMNGNGVADPPDILNLGFSKSRMWSQYGEKHQGICLAFSKDRLIDYLSKLLGKENVFHDKVQYIEGRSVPNEVRVLDGKDVADLEIDDAVYQHIEKHQRGILFTKGMDYRDETEYRIVAKQKETQTIAVPTEQIIIGAFLGDRFPNWLSNLARDLCSRNGTLLRRIYWYNGTLMVTQRLEI